MLDFLNTVADWLGAARYAAHSICLSADPTIVGLFLAGDLVTAASYFVMGVTFMVYRTRIIRMSPEARGLWGAFVFLCGLSHAAKSATLFIGVYRLEVLVVMAMAAVSAVTAVVTVRQIGEWTRQPSEL